MNFLITSINKHFGPRARRLWRALRTRFIILREAVKVWLFSPEVRSTCVHKQPKKVRFFCEVDSHNLVKFQAACRRRNAQRTLHRAHVMLDGFNVFRHFYQSQWLLVKEQAARKIQRAWRSARIREQVSLCLFSRKLQKASRSYLAKHRALGYRDASVQFESINLRRFQAAARGFLAKLKFKQNKFVSGVRPIINTAFPRLGFEDVDGCDCWCQCANICIPKKILLTLFGKNIPSQQSIMADLTGVRFGSNFNGSYLFLAPINDTYILYDIKDCHVMEQEVGLTRGHRAREIAILRHYHDQVLVLKFTVDQRIMDLSGFLIDQHIHVAHVRTVLNVIPLVKTGEMVESNGELLDRAEKAARRRERRARNAALRANGLKPTKVQQPYWAQGLTTQEYHEVKTQRLEWALARWEEAGFKSLPQLVRNYFQTPAGNELWLNIHRWHLSRPEFATKQLQKLNKNLKHLGLTFDLTMNPNIIKKMREEITVKNDNRVKQLVAAEIRGSKVERSNQLNQLISQTRARAIASIANDWSVETDDDLPSLDGW